MTIDEIAQRFTALCREGRFSEAGETFWSPDVVSIEPMGPEPVARGLDALRAKHAWWEQNNEVHGSEVHGPYVHGDQFAVRFVIDTTTKATGQRMRLEEIGLYTVRDGKVVEERFFYGAG
jgi:ketosteroid isomerase-like protein